MSQKSLLIDKSISKIEYIFRMTGMHFRTKNFVMAKARSWYYFNFIWLNSDVFGAIVWFFKEASKGDNLTSLTYIAPCIFVSTLANIKAISSIWYAENIDELVTKLRGLEMKADIQRNEMESDIQRPLNYLNSVLKVLNVLYWILIILFPLMPLTLIAYKYIVSNKIVLLLPFFIEYPFDAFNIKYWPFILLKQIWSEILCLLKLFGFDALYYICSSFLVIQFKLLHNKILKIIPVKLEIVERGDERKEFQRRIIELVLWHEELIQIVAIMETIYSKSTLFNFIFSSVMICLCGFNVMTMDDKPFMVTFLGFLLISLLQIYFLCSFGDMLMTCSGEIRDAVYNCKWYCTTIKNTRDLHSIQMRAHKPCKLTASGFADVNMDAFAKILKTAWSYFALLNTVTK